VAALEEASITPESLARERCTEIRAGTPPLTIEFRGRTSRRSRFGGGPVVRWLQVRGPSVGLARRSVLNKGFNAKIGESRS
jgi:hypothetical protein